MHTHAIATGCSEGDHDVKKPTDPHATQVSHAETRLTYKPSVISRGPAECVLSWYLMVVEDVVPRDQPHLLRWARCDLAIRGSQVGCLHSGTQQRVDLSDEAPLRAMSALTEQEPP